MNGFVYWIIQKKVVIILAKRTTKFYRKNEEEVMESLGLKPTKNSGSGWIQKKKMDKMILLSVN